MVSEGDISKPKCCKSLIRVQSWPGERRLSGLPLLGAVSCAHLLSPASRWLRHGGAKHRGVPTGTVAAWASGKIPAKDWLWPKNLHLVFLLCITLKLCPALDRGEDTQRGSELLNPSGLCCIMKDMHIWSLATREYTFFCLALCSQTSRHTSKPVDMDKPARMKPKLWALSGTLYPWGYIFTCLKWDIYS